MSFINQTEKRAKVIPGQDEWEHQGPSADAFLSSS
jgi:carbon monoxide dehydrogenase subunit G